MTNPRLISIILYDGDPEGLREADIKVSTIKAIAFPRNQLGRAVGEVPELKSPGSYVLFGPNPTDDDRPTAYIGESEDVAKRLSQHAVNGSNAAKQEQYEHWVDTIALVSKDRSLTKAHALYLESRLADLAKKNPSWAFRSGKTPGEDAGALTKPDKIAAEEFLDQAILLMGTLGLDLFKASSVKALASSDGLPGAGMETESSPMASISTLEFGFAGNGFGAKMAVTLAGKFAVKKGSRIRKAEVAALSSNVKKLRADLLSKNFLADKGDAWELIDDYEFSSASAAAATVSGTTVNGRTAWKLSDGRTYAQLEEAAIAAEIPPMHVDRASEEAEASSVC